MVIVMLRGLSINNLLGFRGLMHLDLVSLSLLILTFWLTALMVSSQFLARYKNGLILIFLFLSLSLVFSFLATNILIFYFFFEWSLLPIFLIIIGWGYQIERLKARLFMLFYTLFASLPLLVIILIFGEWGGSVFMGYLSLINKFLNVGGGYILIIIMAFLVKFPLFFVHQWLPKAHVEAPVGGSIILAGVLLKLGGYGIIRMAYLYGMSPLLNKLMLFSLLGGGLLGVVCLCHRDMKVIIAYSSVVHMALIIIGTISLISWGVCGAIVVIVAHGVCSSGIFSCANIMYERSHSRRLIRNKGALNIFPSLRLIWFFLCMANFGGPFTLNLLGEILLIINLGRLNMGLLLRILLISFFSAAYRLVLYASTQQGKILVGTLRLNNMNSRELLVLVSHIWPVLVVPVSCTLL